MTPRAASTAVAASFLSKSPFWATCSTNSLFVTAVLLTRVVVGATLAAWSVTTRALQRRFPPSAAAKPASCELLADGWRRSVVPPSDGLAVQASARPSRMRPDDPAAHRLAGDGGRPPDRRPDHARLALPGLCRALHGGRRLGGHQPPLSSQKRRKPAGSAPPGA